MSSRDRFRFNVNSMKLDPNNLVKQDYSPTYADRMEAVGLDYADALDYADDRNFIQKQFNIQNKGALGGTFELLGRLGHGVRGGLDALTRNEDEYYKNRGGIQDQIEMKDKAERGVLGSMWAGVAGHDKFHGNQLLRNVLKGGELKQEGDGFDLFDLGGIVVDSLTNPLNWKLLPDTKVIGEASKQASEAHSIASKLSGGLSKQAAELTAESDPEAYAKLIKKINKLTEGSSSLSAEVDAVKAASRVRNPTELKGAMESLTKGAKLQSDFLAGKLAELPGSDFGKQSVNQWLANKTMEPIKKGFKGFKELSDADRAQEFGQKLGEYIGEPAGDLVAKTGHLASSSSKRFVDNISKSLTPMYENKQEAQQALNTIVSQAAPEMQEFTGKLEALGSSKEFLKEFGFKSAEDFEKTLYSLYEYQNLGDKAVPLKELVYDAVSGKTNTLPADNDLIKSLGNFFKSGEINPGDAMSIVKSDGASYIKFNKDFLGENRYVLADMLNKGVADDSFESVGDALVSLGKGYTNKEIRKFEELLNNEGMKNLLGEVDDQIKGIQNIIGTNIYGADHRLGDVSQEGYLPHTLNPKIKEVYNEVADAGKARQRGEDFSKFKEQLFGASYNQPLKERQYPFSADVANRLHKETYSDLINDAEKMAKVFKGNPDGAVLFDNAVRNEELFTKDFTTSFVDLIDNKAPAMANSKARADMVDGLFKGIKEGKRGTVGTVEFVKPGTSTPKGFHRLTQGELRKLQNNLASTDNFTGGGSRYLKSTLNEINGAMGSYPSKDIIVDDRVANLLFYANPTEKDKILRDFDKLMHKWKGFVVTTPSNLPKNEWQNAVNQYSAGISPKEIISSRKSTADMLKKFEANDGELFNKLIKDGAGAFKKGTPERQFADAFIDINGGRTPSDMYRRLVGVDEAFAMKSQGQEVFDKLKGVGKEVDKENIVKQGMNKMFDANNRADEIYRISTHIAAQNNPALYQRIGLDSAKELSSLVHFDPDDLSMFERDTLKRIFPFYTMKKKNIEYHLANIPNNISQYSKYHDLADSLWAGIGLPDSEDRRDYELENQLLPSIRTMLHGADEEGDIRVSKMEAPHADLNQISSWEGLRDDLITSLNPIPKSMIEGAYNLDSFTGRPIEQYKGQPGKSDLFPSRKIEKSFKNIFGSGIPTVYDAVTGAPEAIAQEGLAKGSVDTLEELLNLTYGSNIERNREYADKDLEAKLRDYSRLLNETQGIELPSSNDLKKRQRELENMLKGSKKKKRR